VQADFESTKELYPSNKAAFRSCASHN